MDKLKELISYILIKYPHKDELSNARVTKMVYLADWKQSIEKKRQITNIDWYFDNFGPFVSDVEKTIKKNHHLFTITDTNNIFGYKKKLFSIKDKNYSPQLSQDETAAINHIISETNKLNWDDFIKLVYSTYPVSSSSRYSHLDLVSKAKEYIDTSNH